MHVDTAAHRLRLCRGLLSEGQFRVRLGRGGVGKQREGDHRTPLGTYALGAARPSERFGTFVPVDYPTPEQKAQGYTGSAIGIHGPTRGYAWLGSANTWFDTTEGCIGLASDREMERISGWLRATGAARVYLE